MILHAMRVPRFVAGLILLIAAANANLTAQVVPPRRPQPAQPLDSDVYLVTFAPGMAASEQAVALQQSGVTLRRAFTVANAVSVRVPDGAALARLRNHPRVRAVFPNRPIRLAVAPAPVQKKGKGGGPGSGSGGGGSGGPKPKAPDTLVAAGTSSTEVALAWADKSDNESAFVIERCAGSGCGSFSELVQVGPDTTSYVDSGLNPGTQYRYRVMAVNAAGSSRYSNVADGTTQPAPPTPPQAPDNLTTEAVSLVSVEVDLEWTDNSGDEGGFQIERCTGTMAGCADADFYQIVQLGPNVVDYADLGVDPEVAYTYRVRAYNSAGPSAYSNLSEAITPAAGASSQLVPTGVWRIGAAPGMLSVTGAGVGVAVVDTGLDFNHPDLGMAPEIPGVNAFNAFGGSCQDFHGHGTHVGGTIAARDNTIDVVGVAHDATLYCVGVFTTDPVEGVIATDESLIAGLEWIYVNASLVSPEIRVVNMSLGRDSTPDDADPNHPLRQAIARLHASGIAFAVAAGNDPTVEASTQVPANYPEVMAVASTTAIDGYNGYDEFFGPCVGLNNITADTASYFTTDGAFVGGTGVTVSAPGEAMESLFSYLGSCYLDPIGILSTSWGGGTERLMGTSMASPHLAGVLALMWEGELKLGLTLDPETARARIRGTVDRPGTAPLDSPVQEYSFDGEREGVLWAPAAVGDAPPPTADFAPQVSILGPAPGSTFSAGEVITFQGAAVDPEDGDISSAIVWVSNRDGLIGTGPGFSTALTNGSHVVSASVSDSAQNVASDSIALTVGPSSGPASVEVTSVLYGEAGGTLIVTVGLSDEFGNPVQGADVTVELIEWFYTLDSWVFSGATNTFGTVQFQLNNAPIGCYLTDVQSVAAPGLNWVGGTPSNYYCM